MVSYNRKTSSANSVDSSSSESAKYRGVRKRNWGKWVSEIRLPNSRERIWLGSYDSAEKAARAFDAALFCLRGPKANFNLPNCPPDIPNGMSLSRSEIQSAAAEFANQSESLTYASCSPCSDFESEQTVKTTSFDEFEFDSYTSSSSPVSGSDSLFSDMFHELDVSVSDYGFFDDQIFGYDKFQVQEASCCYEVEDYPQLWNF